MFTVFLLIVALLTNVTVRLDLSYLPTLPLAAVTLYNSDGSASPVYLSITFTRDFTSPLYATVPETVTAKLVASAVAGVMVNVPPLAVPVYPSDSTPTTL